MNERGTFVIRRHEAEKAGLHFDLHLDGETWAIRKGVPRTSGTKVLAIKTAYHSPSEAHFTGTIPKGQYGAGVSEVIDEGEMIMISSEPDYRFFQLRGNFYTGNYHLRHWEGAKWLLWHRP